MRNSRRHSISNLDYESLPPALRRKYFSSLERLRLAQDGKSSLSPPPSRLSILSSNNIWFSALPPATITLPSGDLEPNLLLNGSKLRKRSCQFKHNQLNPSTAAWFASLPPAARRKFFSREECTLYTQNKDSFILDAADETLRRRSWHSTQLLSDDRRISDDQTIVDSEDCKHDCDERVDSAIDMGDYSVDGFPWLEDEPYLDLRLDDYHDAIAQTARRTASFSEIRRPTKRRTSLSSLSIRRGRSSTSSNRPPPPEPPKTPALSTKQPLSRSPSFSVKHVRSQGSVSSIDPRATHYQDPAARLKLRLYLASPQKFDEAIEFGFPSVKDKNNRVLQRPMTSPQPRGEVNRTFFHDDTPELSGDEDDDGDEPDTLYDPRTPEDPVFQMHRPVPKLSLDLNGSLRPFSMRRKTETYARGSTLDREMTLHMTLTRPDLRAAEEQVPPLPTPDHSKINQIPLERPELHLDGPPVSIWDTLPTEESRVKRFFRRLKLR